MSESNPNPSGDSEQDNSSSANVISSLVAERGTTGTGGTGGTTVDDEIETSSIEALNWSEVDEEELQKQKNQIDKANADAAATKTKPETDISTKPDSATTEPPSSSGGTLSTSLVESINSSASSKPNESSKKSEIESWASGVKDAVDRGEIEVQEENNSGNDSSSSSENEEISEISEDGVRKRKKSKSSDGKANKRKSIPIITAADEGDNLSTAPVLDDGPIWINNEDRLRQYQFRENQRINQKLTWGLLFTLVLAVGLGIGNLIAVKEYEAETKSTQLKKPTTSSSSPVVPVTKFQAQPDPNFPETNEQNSHPDDESVQVNSHLQKDSLPPPISLKPEEESVKESAVVNPPPIEEVKEKYTKHIETLSKIVKVMDNLQQKIDNFENKTRKLGGVVMLKEIGVDEDDGILEDEEEDEGIQEDFGSSDDEAWNTPNDEQEVDEVASSSIWDRNDAESFSSSEEEINRLASKIKELDSQIVALYKEEQEAEKKLKFQSRNLLNDEVEPAEDGLTLQLIHGIEETAEYEEISEKFREAQNSDLDPTWIKWKAEKADNPEELRTLYMIEGGVKIYRDQFEEFVRQEREKLRELKILGLVEDRNPAEYSKKEKEEIRKRYDEFAEEYPYDEELDEFIRIKMEQHDFPQEKSKAEGVKEEKEPMTIAGRIIQQDYEVFESLTGEYPEESTVETSQENLASEEEIMTQDQFGNEIVGQVRQMMRNQVKSINNKQEGKKEDKIDKQNRDTNKRQFRNVEQTSEENISNKNKKGKAKNKLVRQNAQEEQPLTQQQDNPTGNNFIPPQESAETNFILKSPDPPKESKKERSKSKEPSEEVNPSRQNKERRRRDSKSPEKQKNKKQGSGEWHHSRERSPSPKANHKSPRSKSVERDFSSYNEKNRNSKKNNREDHNERIRQRSERISQSIEKDRQRYDKVKNKESKNKNGKKSRQSSS